MKLRQLLPQSEASDTSCWGQASVASQVWGLHREPGSREAHPVVLSTEGKMLAGQFTLETPAFSSIK